MKAAGWHRRALREGRPCDTAGIPHGGDGAVPPLL